jgi:hypothetical protein
MDALRRTSLIVVAACGAAAFGLVLVFSVLLEPVDYGGCNTGLIDGPYKSAMVPAHLAATAVLTWALWQQARRTGQLVTATRWVLIAVWVIVAASLIVPGGATLIGFVGVFGGQLIALPTLLVLAVSALAVFFRTHGRGGWDAYAPMTRVLGWNALLLGVPGSIGYYWLEGASPFCF